MSTPHPLVRQFRHNWDAPAFTTTDDECLTYGQLWNTAAKQAERWRAAGLPSGSIIAFRLHNSYRLPCLYLACAIGGYIACPIVPTLAPHTVEENLADLNPALFIDGDLDLPITADDMPEITIDGHKPFLIMFSSGSTGKNKAICHCLDAVIGSAAAFGRLSGFNADSRLYHVLPMTYMAGFLNAMFAVFMSGGHVIEGPQFSMGTVTNFWQHALKTDANILSVIPPLAAAVSRLTRSQDIIDQVARQFVMAQCTSQSIPKELRQRFLSKFSIPLQDCYGMTELGGALTLQSVNDALAMNDSSEPMPELSIETRQDGRLWIRSPFAMLGYLIDGDLHSIADDRGFIDTGDIAVASQSSLEITGRIKDIIIRGGINTSPVRIESVMSQIPGVDEVAVVGRPHAFWGEEIVACIVGTADESAILAFCREHLDQHEVPDRIVFMSSFPRSFIGKLLKSDLAQQLEGT